MTTLLQVSDATIRLAGLWGLIGWAIGFVTALVLWWRPIRGQSWHHAQLRLYMMHVHDLERRQDELRHQNTILAQRLAEAQRRAA